MTPAKKEQDFDCAVQDLRIENLEKGHKAMDSKLGQTRAMGASARKDLDKWVNRAIGVAFAYGTVLGALTLVLTLRQLGVL